MDVGRSVDESPPDWADPLDTYAAEIAALDEWWADSAAAQRDWEGDLAALVDDLESQARADTARRGEGRRGRLDAVPAAGTGVAVAEAVEQADTDDELVSAYAAAQRMASWLVWQQLCLAARLLIRWQARPEAGPSRPGRPGRGKDVDPDGLAEAGVVCELALAARISETAAAARVDAATALIVEDRLPATAALLRAGRLDWSRVNAVVSHTRTLTADDARTVEERVFAVRQVLEFGIARFTAAVDRAVQVVDAEAAERRRRQTRTGRRVSIQALPDGAAAFWAVGPAEAVTAAYTSLDAAARALRSAGDLRTLDQLRHDLFVTGATSGHLPVPADTLPVPRGTTRTTAEPRDLRPDGHGAKSEAQPHHPTPLSEPIDRSAVTQCADGQHRPTCPASSDGPAGRPGRDGGSRGGTSLVPAYTPADDQHEPFDGEGCFVPPWFCTTWPDVQPQIRVTVSLETLLGLLDDPAELDGYGPIAADLARDLAANGIWRCLAVDDQHGTVLGVGTGTFTPGYSPGAKLRQFLQHATPTCGVPRCGTAAWRCDLDHARPHGHGGSTCDCNVRPLCRRHHRLKTAGLLTLTPSTDPHDPPGTWTYTTRTGRAYTAHPHAPLPPDGAPAPPGRTQAGPPTTRCAPPRPVHDAPPF